MATINLYIDIGTGNLLAGLFSSTVIQPTSIPINYGDQPTFNIYLLQRNPTATNPAQASYVSVPLAGLTLEFFLDDGTITPGTIYAQQLTWATNVDANNTPIFQAVVSFLTTALATLIGTATSNSCYLKIGALMNGVATTWVSSRVTVNVGLPTAAAPTPAPGQTALTVQAGNQMYYPIAGLAGLPLTLISAAGKVFRIQAVDNPDGTASIVPFAQ